MDNTCIVCGKTFTRKTKWQTRCSKTHDGRDCGDRFHSAREKLIRIRGLVSLSDEEVIEYMRGGGQE